VQNNSLQVFNRKVHKKIAQATRICTLGNETDYGNHLKIKEEMRKCQSKFRIQAWVTGWMLICNWDKEGKGEKGRSGFGPLGVSFKHSEFELSVDCLGRYAQEIIQIVCSENNIYKDLMA
jgi:hypothetical protein